MYDYAIGGENHFGADRARRHRAQALTDSLVPVTGNLLD